MRGTFRCPDNSNELFETVKHVETILINSIMTRIVLVVTMIERSSMEQNRHLL